MLSILNLNYSVRTIFQNSNRTFCTPIIESIPQGSRHSYVSISASESPNYPNQHCYDAMSLNRRPLLETIIASVFVELFSLHANANQIISSDWEEIDLPIAREIVLLDVGFVDDERGFLLGTRQTLLETKDGGRTWTSREIASAIDEGINYRFNSISVKGEEGWIVGKPTILFHTTDA